MSLSPYPEYKDSGIEGLAEIPAHWATVPIKAVASCNDDVLEEKTPDDFEIDYVEISDVDQVAGITSKTTIPFGAAPSRARRMVREGDVLVSTVRTYLRAIAPVAGDPGNMIASTGFAVIRPRKINPGYLGYACRAEYVIAEVIARSVGVSYPAINASDLMRLQIPLPMADEQRVIALFLDAEVSKIDALVSEQERLIVLLKEKRQAVISHAVTQGLDSSVSMKDSGIEWLGEIPAHWMLRKIKRNFRMVKRQENADLEVLSVYRDYGVIMKSARDDNINKTPEDLSLYQTVRVGDLVINKMKAWQGSLGVSIHEGITSPDYVVFEPTHDEFGEFFHFLLRSSRMPGVYKSISNGIRPDQWRLEPDKFEQLPVLLPPLTEQMEIVSHLKVKIEVIDELVDASEKAIFLLGERRIALISDVVTGKIDVRQLAAAEAA